MLYLPESTRKNSIKANVENGTVWVVLDKLQDSIIYRSNMRIHYDLTFGEERTQGMYYVDKGTALDLLTVLKINLNSVETT